MNVNNLENAILAAKDLGIDEMPWAWLKYMQSGWKIQSNSCTCGGKWAWMKPRPSGAMVMHGCVCHTIIDINNLLDSKNANLSSLMRKCLEEADIKKEDIGKIIYTSPLWQGIIISREDFINIDPADVEWWAEIGEFDYKQKN